RSFHSLESLHSVPARASCGSEFLFDRKDAKNTDLPYECPFAFINGSNLDAQHQLRPGTGPSNDQREWL
ncbi:hypothetical protein, partial [Pontiella sp.]|uniref:hypothetical protein n=1 Tax=Pontiella sp. TaxID=2837462 RepID=UPI0035621E79